MKRFTALFLCFVFIFLISCTKQNGTDNTTSTQNNITTKSTPQNAPTALTKSTQSEPTTVEIPTNPDDPYSTFIKDWYEEIYEAQKDSGAEYFGEFDKHSWDCYYYLYDIDGNGIKELILGDWKSVTNNVGDLVEFAPTEIMISHICTLKNGEVTKQESFWWQNNYLWDTVLLSNGLIRQSMGFEEYPSYFYFFVENETLKFKFGVCYTQDVNGDRFYSYVAEAEDGKYIEEKITKEEFERLRDEANGDAEVVEINWKRIDEYGK